MLLSQIKNDQEIIVMGRGLAFNKRVDDEVNEDLIDKIFTLEDADITKKFKTLIVDIPMEYMELSEKIINHAKIALGKKLDDTVYISLTDYIHYAIERHNNGIPSKNQLLWEIKNLYKEEFNIGIEALNMIFEQFNVILPEDEAAFLIGILANGGETSFLGIPAIVVDYFSCFYCCIYLCIAR